MVNQETVYAPFEVGGKKLLDIGARNDAISLTWLKSYLDLSANRPRWAYIADRIMAFHAPNTDQCVDPALRINMFIQRWGTSSQKLPPDLKRMVDVSKKYGLEVDMLAPSRSIARRMPIWYHIFSSGSRSLFNSGPSTCLKNIHHAYDIGEMERLTRRLNAPGH